MDDLGREAAVNGGVAQKVTLGSTLYMPSLDALEARSGTPGSMQNGRPGARF